MPELPEVETIRRGLSDKIINKKIKKVTVNFSKIVKSDLAEFKKTLLGNKFTAIDRIGKLLILKLTSNDRFLLIHLKMTGQLIFCFNNKIIAGGHSLPKLPDSLPNKYSHFWLEFSNGAQLFFNDMRKFGYLRLVDGTQLAAIKETYGIEPLTKNFTVEKLIEIFKKRKISVKAVLLDQIVIAGIGNIYADEILFASHILPDRPASFLKKDEVKAIFSAAQAIIKKAIKFRGTTFNDYVDADGQTGNFVKYLKVYGRTNLPCLGCESGTVKKIKVAGRGTHFCSKCQK
jgi:formamidopyrimidine-DNA glycosylase